MGEIAINPIHNVHKKYRQMNLVNPYIFAPPVDLSTNTEIGGVAATISTPALLATKLGIDVSRISNFTIVGSDIKCRITGSYGIPTEAFKFNATPCTYYRDTDYLITSVGNQSFYYTNISGIINFENCTSVAAGGFQGTPLLTEILLKNCTSIGDNGFAESTNGTRQLKICYIPNVTTLGTTSGNNSVFAGNCTGLKIYVHPSLATNNGGAPDGDIAYAISQGAIVRYVTNFTAPNPVTDLSAGTIYNTTVQLNFTAPTGSTNAIEYYECYANGVLKNTITASGQYITGLTPSTSYNITLIAVDIFYNKSVVSNSLSVSTTNRAAVDADAIAYITASSNTTYQDIIDDMFVSLKSNSIYAKLQAFYPFLGTTAAQHKWNAKNPLDTDAAFRLTFTGAATFSNNGYQLNGSSYANTHFTPSTSQSINSNGATIVIGTNNAAFSGDTYEYGSINGSQYSFMTSKRENSTYAARARMNNGLIERSGVNESRGVLTAVRQNSTDSRLIKNGVVLATDTAGGGSLPTINQFIGGINLNGSVYGNSNQRIQSVYIHEGLTNTEVATLYTIIDVFETALGRKTW